MWHEARKQERKIRGIMVDYKKRAERRRDFYEKIVSFTFGLLVGRVMFLHDNRHTPFTLDEFFNV